MRAIETSEASATPLLDRVKTPADLKQLAEDELPQLADELRQETVSTVAVTGGHLGAGLGVVELTIALHYVFDTPQDRLIWDVGHQAYPHKILTGRRDRIRTLRQGGGLSGFTKRAESEYDPFGAAHSSTSISAGLGMVRRTRPQGAKQQRHRRDRRRRHERRHGLRGHEQRRRTRRAAHRRSERQRHVDRSANLARCRVISPASPRVAPICICATSPSSSPRSCPSSGSVARRAWRNCRAPIGRAAPCSRSSASIYVGPIDGHDLSQLLPVLKNVRDAKQGPILVHAVTKKGKGYAPAEASPDKYHGVVQVQRRYRSARQAKGRRAVLYARVRR